MRSAFCALSAVIFTCPSKAGAALAALPPRRTGRPPSRPRPLRLFAIVSASACSSRWTQVSVRVTSLSLSSARTTASMRA
jgi:hypothetical protein